MNRIEHLLACLAEECGEVAKECHKAQRFGLDDQVTLNPEGPPGTEGPTNREKIVIELNDLIGVVLLLVEAGALPRDWKDDRRQWEKGIKVHRFMRYAERVGALQPSTPPTQPKV